jgi:hypothetical protein
VTDFPFTVNETAAICGVLLRGRILMSSLSLKFDAVPANLIGLAQWARTVERSVNRPKWAVKRRLSPKR